MGLGSQENPKGKLKHTKFLAPQAPFPPSHCSKDTNLVANNGQEQQTQNQGSEWDTQSWGHCEKKLYLKYMCAIVQN